MAKKKKNNNKKKYKKRGGYMARRKKKYRRRMTIPIAPIIGLVAGVADAVPAIQQGNMYGALNALSKNYVGYDIVGKKWDYESLKKGLVPLVAGLAIHKIVGSWLGLNRILGRSKVPIVRI